MSLPYINHSASPAEFMILLINGLFAQSLRYAQKIILGISTICLRLFFAHALILNENLHKSTESFMNNHS